jgi:hypothetical protein
MNVQDQSIWSSRLPQEMQRRSSRCHTSAQDSLTLVGDQAPRKDDGTDFGFILIQSNGVIVISILRLRAVA